MYEVRVEADFAAAHFLKDYHGKCENLHGHNYQVFAHARGSELDEGGMLLDFTQLKGALRAVCKKVDHTNLNDLVDEKTGALVFKNNPSAERIATWIFHQIEQQLEADPATRGTARLLYAVDVFETPTSRARYIRD
ncbi:MAG: 6-carboxytetrahydropterin synthase QueD [Treponemataceae bacterium]|nr:6-carboxytetrahydropterin synthase QueD [Treponemataceae bacterium]